MNKDEKRRLKKLGKQVVAERSRELQERLHEANPAPIGSDEWAKNYREGTDSDTRQRVDDVATFKALPKTAGNAEHQAARVRMSAREGLRPDTKAPSRAPFSGTAPR